MKTFRATLWPGVAGVLLAVGSAVAAGPTHGDVTDRLEALANPLAELGVPVDQRVYGDVRAFAGKLFLAYGNTGNATPKWVAVIDPTTGAVTREGFGGEPIEAERLGRFRVWGDELYLVVDDRFGNDNDVGVHGVRDRAGRWRTVNQQLVEDHNPDVFLFDGKSFLGSRSAQAPPMHDAAKLGLSHAPLDAAGRVAGPYVESPHQIDWVPAEALARVHVHSFFTFRGVLYGSSFHGSDLPFADADLGDVPYLLAWDPAIEPRAWRLAHGEPGALYPPGTLFRNPRHGYEVAFALQSAVEVATEAGPRLVMIGTRRRDPFPEGEPGRPMFDGSRHALYVASSLDPPTMALVPLAGLPTRRPVRSRLVERGGVLYVVSTARSYPPEPPRPDAVLLHRCVDPARAAEPDAWQYVLRFDRDGFSYQREHTVSCFEAAGGAYYFAESRRKGRNDDTAGTVWRFSP